MILADWQIQNLIDTHDLISPYTDGLVVKNPKGEKVISFGLSSYGYDARLDTHFKVFHNAHTTIIDPKNFDPKNFVEIDSTMPVAIPPNSFALSRTIERFCIPRHILAICLGKSTYARCGLIVNVTPLEPEWRGHVTIELSNTTPSPILVYPGEGICQFIFLEGRDPETSYDDRNGKYQDQQDVTPPLV